MKQKLRYRRIPGRVLRPDAARNARPRKVGITTGLNSKAVRGELDKRFVFARETAKYTAEYQHHVGEDRGVVMADFCRSAGTAKAIRNIALARLMEAGPLDDRDQARAAYESYRKADADLRDILRTLGLERHEKEIADLQTYIKQKAREQKRLPFRIKRSEDVEDAEEV